MREISKYFVLGVLLVLGAGPKFAQVAPSFSNPTVQTNAEVLLRLLGASGVNYRIDTSTNGILWEPWVSFAGRPTNSQTDSAGAFHGRRFYRATEIPTNVITGDHISTSDGEVIVRPVNHASFVMSWKGQMIYNDPVGGATPYRTFPRANLILVSHSHGDHFEATTLTAVRHTNGIIVVPPSIYNGLATSLKTNAVPLANGASTNVLGIGIEAVPAYNDRHARGNGTSGNGYVVTIGGKRFYMAGDTGDIAEMRALRDIDVAFLCMNVPFTMSVTAAANAARDFKPRILYPYHYRNQDGTFADINALKRLIGRDFPIEVRTRAWY